MNLEKSVANRHFGTITPSKKQLMYFIGGKSIAYTILVLNIESNQTIKRHISVYTQTLLFVRNVRHKVTLKHKNMQ